MLNISSSPPANWSPAPSPMVAPVAATAPVTPVQATQRDAQAGSGGSGRAPTPLPREDAEPRSRDGQAGAPKMEAAPLLPRPSPDQQGGEQASSAASEDDPLQADAEREQQAREAIDEELRQRLQDVVSNAWKASAAVVERALGLDDATGSGAVAGAGEAGSRSAAVDGMGAAPSPRAAQLPAGAPGPQAAAANAATFDPGPVRPVQDVVAYDAQGNSSLAPLEAGSLLSRRV